VKQRPELGEKMKFKFNFHQVDSSQALILYSQDEIEKAARYLLTDGSCQVFFRRGRYDCQVQVDINSPWGHFKASGKGADFYSATDDIADKLSKQFKKSKEIHQDHKKVERSKQGRMKRVNSQLEYDNSPFIKSKKAS
jgi:ribosomal subunit interface protein